MKYYSCDCTKNLILNNICCTIKSVKKSQYWPLAEKYFIPQVHTCSARPKTEIVKTEKTEIVKL